MPNKNEHLTKRLLIVLAVVMVVALGFGFWVYFSGNTELLGKNALKNNNPIIVAPLKDEVEKNLGTVVYSAAKVTSNLAVVGESQAIVLQTTDSMDGAINIYAQDLLNRYPNYKVTQKEIPKSEASSGKATVLTCSSGRGNITVTAWTDSQGMTSIEINKDNSF